MSGQLGAGSVGPGWARTAARWARAARDFVRAVSGDDAYERYLEHHRTHHGEAPALSRRAFYEEELQRKWSGINRCC